MPRNVKPWGGRRCVLWADSERPDDDGFVGKVRRLIFSRDATPVEVSDAVQSRVCPWLADEEAKYTSRVARDYRCQDQALLDFFSLVRMSRSVFFQT